MRIVMSAAERVRALVSAKLGRCACCIRWSGKGTFLAWALVVATVLIWPHPLLLGATLLVAGAFSLLMLAHVGTFSVRVARKHARRAGSPGRPLDRRAFLRVGMGAAGGALLLAVTGSVPASAVPEFCADQEFPVSETDADNQGDCRKKLEAKANCAGACAGPCPDSRHRCQPRGKGHIENFDWKFDGVRTTCMGRAKCKCGCRPPA